MKYGLTKKEEKLYARALYYQNKSNKYLLEFRKSLKSRFPNSEVVDDFEAYDLWTLNQSGDCSFQDDVVEDFWREVKAELER